MEKLLPILSGSLYEVFKVIRNKYDDPIASIICKTHELIDTYNRNTWISEDDALYSVFSLVPDAVNELVTNSVRMITARMGGDFEVSFLPEGKEAEYNDNGDWARKNRQSGKPTRIFQKLVRKEFKTIDWETFNNRLKAEICCCTNFEIVEGEDIRKWYLEDNYFKIAGSLGNSCMRYQECQKYMNIYVDNAKMLISKKDDLLTGRAIVWELDNGVTLLDRIYTCFDYLDNCFIDYAKDNGWWIREYNSLLSTGETQGWKTPKDDYREVTYEPIKIDIKKCYEYFPYVDSFRYFDGEHTVCTKELSGFTNSLDRTDGYWQETYSYTCARCGHTSYTDYEDDLPEDMHYSEYDDDYYCDDCCWYCEALSDYISSSHDVFAVLDEDDEEIDYPDDYILDHVVVNEDDAKYKYGDKFVKIDEKYYFYTDPRIEWNAEEDKFILNESED